MTGATEARIAAVLDRIGRHDGVLNCFTTILSGQALAAARAQDARDAAGEPALPLAGVPFAVKNLFDVEGVTTLAGSKILADQPPAATDAFVVRQLRRAGGILVGCLNMDEFAYGFSTENAHHGRTRNPHDPERMAGGSSGGSAAAVAAGLVPLALGSDTNGSIRVPASLCGVFGLKPTYGRLSRAGAYPFVSSFDHVGPFARTVRELALAYDCMQGDDPHDPVQCTRPIEPTVFGADARPPRVARLRGWFDRGSPEARAAVDRVAEALGGAGDLDLPETDRARSAAFCISASEGGALHLPRLSLRAMEYDPATRERLLAGALLPAAVLVQAQRFRSWYRRQVLTAFEQYDVLLAPATPCMAPRFDDPTILLDDAPVPARANLGLFAQPISFIGLPVVTVPVCEVGALPIGVQLITRPFAEALGLQLAERLEAVGVAGCQALDYV
ncbi:AtzE family amidohydrolase [Lichenicoccus roseus]|uniref:AtzE family amidohydrolase n=1 Tax=Lichenicoccus roseus TaxID=2683649 RepID=A0A5R9J6F8_9PROT|nr:AtzE family amidohydrolase [Lichenicoccus roseus]TLU72443.1 AtzE family amidohydrolase [Lichenicoccus roseus]